MGKKDKTTKPSTLAAVPATSAEILNQAKAKVSKVTEAVVGGKESKVLSLLSSSFVSILTLFGLDRRQNRRSLKL
jgi:hypothetical protein